MKSTQLIFITYDGIHNSVFAGQVLQPLIDQRQKNYNKKICLISFEFRYPSTSSGRADKVFEHIKKQCMQYDIQLIIGTKKHFIWKHSLNAAARQLKTIVSRYKTYELVARGPLAGYIALRTVNEQCEQVIIQARGLLAEEYAYTHRNTNMFTRFMHRIRTKQFKALEKYVYSTTQKNVTVECVSPALKKYLIEQFNAQEKQITMAQHDMPIKINATQKTEWRTAIRKQLGISTDTHVYCYNGSAKPWQCPNETLQFFKEQQKQNKDSFLLILSQDVAAFKKLAQQHNLNAKSYQIKAVPHTQIYQYLSACDTGLIFRDKNMLNWVSRPTKILEYQAAGLDIKHNNTIKYLS